jgi:glycosyltransferase A (GT-A) superfamily protein (DUF2064 family)
MARGIRAALLVLAKAPVPGEAKTRLCPPATPDQAARIAAAAFLDTLDAVLAVPDVMPVVALAGDLSRAVSGDALSTRLRATTVVPQRGTTLGQRIAAAHADAAAMAGRCPVLQIGMDTPQADAGLLSHCIDLLDGAGATPGLGTALGVDAALGADAALGMATDGGWWVLGVRRPELAGLLAGIPMSRADTGLRTLAALHTAGCQVVKLPELSDVDTWEDAVAVARGVPGGRFAAAVAAGSAVLDGRC